MKPLLPAVLTSLLVGGLLGYSLPILTHSGVSPTKLDSGENALSATADSEMSADLEEENVKLKARLDALERELERRNASFEALVEKTDAQVPEPTEAQLRQLKKEWIENALSGDGDPRSSRRAEREFNQMVQNLGLTPDQAQQLGLLMEKREQQRRLSMMRAIGLISEEEYSSMFAELDAFDFNVALNSILSPDQQSSYQTEQSQQWEQGMERVSRMMSERLNLSDERYSEAERASINSAIKTAMNRQAELSIPPAIRELDINKMDKRILAAGFEQLDSDTFEKLYESVVEQAESGEPMIFEGGRRPGPPPRD